MPTGIQISALGAGFGVEYLDESGGMFLIAIDHPTYLSQHRLRVIPFTADGNTNPFTSAGGGTTTSMQQETDNVMALLKACYASDTSAAVVQAYQVDSDNKGQHPVGFNAGSGGVFANGTTGTVSDTPAFVADLVATTSDGARWRFAVPGPSGTIGVAVGRFSGGGSYTPFVNLLAYLTGSANGPVHAVKTNVVAHDGLPLVPPGFLIVATNKRIRRHLKIS